MLLCNAWRAFVNQQIAHCHVGVAQIGAEKRLAKEINELITGRMAAEELAARGGLVKGGALVPQYHRLSQAERERLARENTQQ